jgi:hypothetical protein
MAKKGISTKKANVKLMVVLVENKALVSLSWDQVV